MPTCLGITASVLLPALLAAQTFVVGPSGQFATIGLAVSVVPDGSTLRVMAGTYTGFTVIGKGLTVLADPGVVVGPITIQNTGSQQLVEIVGVQLQASLALMDCAGPVVLRRLRAAPPTTLQSVGGSNCAQILIDDSTLPMGSFTSCPAVTMIGSALLTPMGDALRVVASSLTAVDCEMHGGISWTGGSGYAISMAYDAQVRLLGLTALQGGTDFPSGMQLPSVSGQGVLRLGPATDLVGASMSPTLIVPECALRTSPASLGQPTTATLRSELGALACTMFGLPGATQAVPGFAGDLWLEPTSIVFGPLGIVSGPTTTTANVPANPLLQGQTFAWQAVTYAPTVGFTLSNAEWFRIQ